MPAEPLAALPTPPRLDVELRTDEAIFEDPTLARFWDDAIDQQGARATFRARTWLSTWWHHFGREGALRVLVARTRDGAPVGLLPLFEGVQGVGLGLRWRRWQLLGTGLVGSDYLGPIARPEHQASVCSALMDALYEERPDAVDLADLESDEPLLRARWRGATASHRFVCPYLATSGSFEAYLAARPDGLGAQLRRRARWLERELGAELEVVDASSSQAQVEDAMSHLLRLHRARWALRGGSDGIAGPRAEAFHLDVAKRLSQLGWLRLFLLVTKAGVLAALYAVERANVLQFYQAGFDPDWSARSVGTVLMGHVVRRCFESEIVEFDFLRGNEEYKMRWATAVRHTWALRLVSPGARARLAGWVDGTRRRSRRALGGLLPAWVQAAWHRHERRRDSERRAG